MVIKTDYSLVFRKLILEASPGTVNHPRNYVARLEWGVNSIHVLLMHND